MVSFLVLATLFATGSAESQNAKTQALYDAMKSRINAWASHYNKQRRLQTATCWDDCPGENDNHTVCKKPERCDAELWKQPCVSDCTDSYLGTMVVCETKQFCVDNQKASCPTTLGLLQGAAEYPDAVPCAPCLEHSAKMAPVMAASGMNTMEFQWAKMTMMAITEDQCPITQAAGQCALDNPECLDPTKSSDGGFMMFSALCDCPCGGKLAKFFWDIDAMMMTACKKAFADGFKSPLPGMADLGPLLFASGVLECLGCAWNEKACMASFDKWMKDPGMKQLMQGLMSMKQKCDEEPPTTTTTTTVAPTEEPATTSFAPRACPFWGFLVAAFVVMKLR